MVQRGKSTHGHRVVVIVMLGHCLSQPRFQIALGVLQHVQLALLLHDAAAKGVAFVLCSPPGTAIAQSNEHVALRRDTGGRTWRAHFDLVQLALPPGHLALQLRHRLGQLGRQLALRLQLAAQLCHLPNIEAAKSVIAVASQNEYQRQRPDNSYASRQRRTGGGARPPLRGRPAA